ncbi:ABC transporter ATP-binding protein [Leptolyngbya sp. NIES-2104]|uniref:ABC transporter ATP-binding protein n=1 Tax=Leptolyngbya sp. NIES-2104 TaxID=1552121 RepID=UPI0006EC520C|nr:ABC transporter ATP-binding protein [Leptolyngbya sp. NIES-2104]GAP97857.1 ABC-type multidrug transport system, ATPase component [Leptolyngbya sp. NIES-2104]
MIEVEQLSKVYGSTAAIEDVTFSVEPGEILGFLGPNGAGKTTTMRILSGYLPASRGTAKIAGFEVHENLMQVRQKIGYLPESPPLYPEMTVQGFLNFVAQIKGVSAGDRASRIQTALEKTGLVEKRKTIIRKLSKGYRQRVGIAQAIVHDPPVIILDEPTVGLDPRQIIEVRNLIKQLANDHTVILSTHILPEVSMTCDRVTIINRGRVVATNTPNQLMAQLNRRTGYELEVEGNWNAIEQCLNLIQNVQSIEQLARTENRYRVRVVSESGTEPGREISMALASYGIELYEMRRVQASLEDVFLELTTEEKPVEDHAEEES